jgi:acyl-CoA reductase-like NAD-dependent aldehyde dehydrogenase
MKGEDSMKNETDLRPRLEAAHELAERMAARRDDLAEAGAADAGFPVKVTMLEADISIQHLRSMDEEAAWVAGGSPYGTVGAIFPYDAPVVMMAKLGGAALLSANRLRFSFSSWTPRSARLIADMASRFATFEPAVGQDNREFGHRCVRDPAVRVLFMSGASAVGAAYRGHRESFEKLFFAGPGGMPAAVVFADADPMAAARFIGQRAFVNGGQYCTTLKKALIHASLYERIRDDLTRQAEALKVGDPLDLDTDIGPIRVERTINIVEHALNQCEGARILTGGIDRPYVHPLVLEVDRIPDLELFGPFLALKPFDDSEAVVKEVVQTRYGFLLAYFGTPPHGAREAFSESFGMVHANPDFLFTPLRLPFGGRKESGWILERRGGEWIERDGAFLYSRELVRV